MIDMFKLIPSSLLEWISLSLMLVGLVPGFFYYYLDIDSFWGVLVLSFYVTIYPWTIVFHTFMYSENSKDGLKSRVFGVTERDYLINTLCFHTGMPKHRFSNLNKKQLTARIERYKINSLVK